MNPNPISQSTPGVPAARETAHVVYDAATGAILHVHHSVTFEGAAAHRESHHDRARRHAGAGPDAPVIDVDPAEVNHRRPVRVDPATRTIVPG